MLQPMATRLPGCCFLQYKSSSNPIQNVHVKSMQHKSFTSQLIKCWLFCCVSNASVTRSTVGLLSQVSLEMSFMTSLCSYITVCTELLPSDVDSNFMWDISWSQSMIDFIELVKTL